MKNKMESLRIDARVFAAHTFFILGVALLFFYAEQSDQPIHIEQSELINIVLLYAVGYLLVFKKWLVVIKSNNLYCGKADDVPKYLTDMLWGAFPYLGTFGKSGEKYKQARYGNRWNKYQDIDVQGKTFSQIFCIHVNKAYLLISMLIVVLLPYMFLNQEAPSFLELIYYSSTVFTIYMSFIALVWLSAISIIALRILLLVKE
jgi:hypothetical protein